MNQAVPDSSTGDLVLVANAGDSTIGAFALVGDALTPLATSEVGRGCSTFAIDEARNLLYASAKPAAEGGSPGIDTFAVDRATGTLTHLHHREVPGGMTYLALSPNGTRLAGAAYHEGFAATWLVADDGSLGPLTDRVDWPNTHCVVLTDGPTGGHLYAVSLGADVIAQYAMGRDGRLTPLDPATAPAPSGSGPRHLVLSPEGTRAYVVTEFSGWVLHYDRHPTTGVLTLRDGEPAYAPGRDLGHSRFGADPRAEHLIWGADLHLARQGRFVLASERCESTLAALPVAADGRVGPMADLVDVVRQPRGFAVSTDGRYAVVAGEGGHDLDVIEVGRDGQLRSLNRVPTGAKANWVRTVPRRL